MSYLSPIPMHWIHSVHPSTNVSNRPASPDHPRGVRFPNSNSNNNNISNPNLMEEQLRKDAIERSSRYNTRSSHLPYRGPYHARNRLVRAINGQPVVGSTVDADEVSDEEIAMDNKKASIARFGHKSIVAIGRRRTAFEEDISAEEDNHGRRPGYASSLSGSDSSSEDEEGGPGAFVGGHTGHVAAELAATRERERERVTTITTTTTTTTTTATAREPEISLGSDSLQAAFDARDRAQEELDRLTLERDRAIAARDLAIRLEEERRRVEHLDRERLGIEAEIDLDADIEDLDDE